MVISDWMKWGIKVVVSTTHMEDTIKSFLKNRVDPVVNANPGVLFINDRYLATEVLQREVFNRKGYLDESFGLYSFRPFALQQLLNDDIHGRFFSTTKIALSQGRTNQVASSAQEIMQQHLQDTGTARIDLLMFFRKVALKIAIRMTFGVDLPEEDFNLILEGIRNIDEYVKRISTMDLEARVNCWKTIRKIWHKFVELFSVSDDLPPQSDDPDQSIDELSSFTDATAQKRNELLSKIGTPCTHRTTSFVEVLCQLKRTNMLQMSEHEVVDHILSGFLTSFTIQVNDLVCHTLVCLNDYPEVYKLTMDELRTVFTEPTQQLTSKSLLEFKYLKQCMNETMRVFPLNPLLGRVAKEDASIDVGNNKVWNIKKGTELIISCTAIQREGWKNPEEFNPSRFAKDGEKKGYYIPFGAGPRSCPAGNLGMHAAQAVLITVLSSLDVRVYQGFCHQRSLWYGVPAEITPLPSFCQEAERKNKPPKISWIHHIKKTLKHFVLSKLLPSSAWIFMKLENLLGRRLIANVNLETC